MPYDSVYLEKRPPGALRTVWRKFYGDTTAMIGLYGCAGLLLLCVFGGWFAPYGIDQQFLGYQLLPPSWSRYGEVSFFLGTDDLGRDVLSRLLSGAAPTVGGAFVVTLGATLFGLVLGVIAGSTHGLRSAVMNHILDTLLSIPSLLLAIIVVAFAGPHLSHAMFAVWLALLPRMVRSAGAGESGTAQLVRQGGENFYGRVLLFAHAVPPEIEALAERCALTLLLCLRAETASPCRTVRFTPEDYAQRLHDLEFME